MNNDLQEQLPFSQSIRVEEENTFILQQLEVFNWGPFAGLHRVEFDARGTAIIGPTGSGKTTLVDALMTLLVAQPRYNLASTGGHESDRTLPSYVRGVLGGDGSDGREEVARPGKTITGICATYSSDSETVKLGGALWIDGASNAMADLKRRWFFSTAEEQSLEKWLRMLNDHGIRELMRSGRETAGLQIFDSKKAYLARVRKFFDVNENAFTLLNRAAGLKQLNSIDEIFRDLVLDDRSMFLRAEEVASEFDNLAGIHAELETARRQQMTLTPVAEENQKRLKSQEEADRLNKIKQIVPVWYAMQGQQRWATVAEKIEAELGGKRSLQQAEADAEQVCAARVQTLFETYQNLGGNVISELQRTIEAQQEVVAEKQKHAGDYVAMTKAFTLSEELSETALEANQEYLTNQREQIQTQRDNVYEEVLEWRSQQRDSQTKADEVNAALQKVKNRPSSNIPPRFQDFRAELSQQLDMSDEDLPFLAELVEVKNAESDWRGAIERAMGAERLRVLVPADKIDQALQWVNYRDNRLHVRLERAAVNEAPGNCFEDGFVRKLNFKQHALQDAASRMLSRYDLHCVDSPAALRTTEHALTIEGLISRSRGRFDKKDQRRLNDDWLTGFDNKERLATLGNELKLLQQEIKQHSGTSTQKARQLSGFDAQLTLIDRVLALEFSTIDLPAAESSLDSSQSRLQELLDPSSDASLAKSQYEEETKQLTSIKNRISELKSEIAVHNANKTRAVEEQARAAKRIGNGLSGAEAMLAEKLIPIPPDLIIEDLPEAERQAASAFDNRHTNSLERVAGHEKELIRLMGKALRVDTGALAETGSELEDIPDYLEQLRILTEEGLPGKLARFLDYLNRSSDQGVTQLLASITEEVELIEHRINELNQTLLKVDFRSGRYLQLQPQRIKHERLRTLEAAMRKLRAAALKDDSGESHYKSLREMVEILRDAGQNQRKQGSRALLDPRYRLRFFVVEVDRKTGDRSPPRIGSQSGSGGEKELMASHVLTASLSYALCPPEAPRPLYGTVILDEAFSKSSPSAATRIIEALRIFCLHPVFVTPNKEIGLLKKHTRRVICVQRKGKAASIASISWEKLERLVRPK